MSATKLTPLHSFGITGILYDLRELVSVYHGNLIALVIGIAIPIFNHNINNPGMYFIE